MGLAQLGCPNPSNPDKQNREYWMKIGLAKFQPQISWSTYTNVIAEKPRTNILEIIILLPSLQSHPELGSPSKRVNHIHSSGV
jgi:hypothetical protein